MCSETGRYEKGRNDSGRVCQLCNSGSVEDEFHFLLKCPLYKQERETVLNEIYKDNQNLLNLSDKQNVLWIFKTAPYYSNFVIS